MDVVPFSYPVEVPFSYTMAVVLKKINYNSEVFLACTKPGAFRKDFEDFDDNHKTDCDKALSGTILPI